MIAPEDENFACVADSDDAPPAANAPSTMLNDSASSIQPVRSARRSSEDILLQKLALIDAEIESARAKVALPNTNLVVAPRSKLLLYAAKRGRFEGKR